MKASGVEKLLAARAPGKLMVAGEYAVLDGHPALCLAVDRYAVATVDEGAGEAPPEVAASFAVAVERGALERSWPVRLDLRAMRREDGQKLGVGSSSAGAVAALAAALAAEGRAVDRALVAGLCREGHRRAQGGGSGVDVLTSAHGGLVQVTFPDGRDGAPSVEARSLPEELPWAVLWCGASARTSEMVARVRALQARDPRAVGEVYEGIAAATEGLAGCLARGDFRGCVAQVAALGGWMDTLGARAEAPIVLEGLRALAAEVRSLGAAVKPSGAGGGDVALVVAEGPEALAEALAVAEQRGFARVPLAADTEGARALEG